MTPPLTLHVLPFSHPCLAAETAIKRKNLVYERAELQFGRHGDEMERIYGGRMVPGLLVGDEPVHGTGAIMRRLDELAPEPALFPADRADAVRDAEAWGDEVLQEAARTLLWGALYFRPEALGTFGGAPPLDPAGTDFAMRFVRGAWKYRGITAVRVANYLTELPGILDHVEELTERGVIGADEPNAADLQLGASLA